MVLRWEDEVVSKVGPQTQKKRPQRSVQWPTKVEHKRGATVGSVALYVVCVLGMMALAAWPPR